MPNSSGKKLGSESGSGPGPGLNLSGPDRVRVQKNVDPQLSTAHPVDKSLKCTRVEIWISGSQQT